MDYLVIVYQLLVVMFSSIKSLLGIIDRASEQIEYWKEYQGTEICIRTHTLERGEEQGSDFSQTSYIIKGTIEDVMSYPPGFLLSEVEEIVTMSAFELLFGAGTTEALDIQGGPEAFEVIREIDEKFVSFDIIEQLERRENVENAVEPFREEVNHDDE